MKNRVDRNRISAVRIAKALDDAALHTEDPTMLRRLGQLRNLALDSRTASSSAPRTDRRTLAACRRLDQRLKDGCALWELTGVLAEIERGLFDRERRSGEESPLYEQKRRMFSRLRAVAAEMDALECRQRELTGADSDAASIALCRDEYDLCRRRMKLLQAEYRRTAAALQAMDSVHLLHSEEAMLDSLERDCAALPEIDVFELRALRTQLRNERLEQRTESVLRLRSENISAHGGGETASGNAGDVSRQEKGSAPSEAPVRNIVLPPRFRADDIRMMLRDRLGAEEKEPEEKE